MKLSQCKYGILVKFNDNSDLVGMIVGITNNAELASADIRDDPANAIPLVKWSGRHEPVGVHHGNLSIFKD